MSIQQFLPNTTPQNLLWLATREEGLSLQAREVFRDVDFCYCDFECPYQEPAFAEIGGIGAHNDSSAFLFAKSIPTDTISFKLFKNGVEIATLTDDTYGTFFAIGGFSVAKNPAADLYTGFLLDFEKVLTLNGAGIYQFKSDQIILGVVNVFESQEFRLMEYSDIAADQTVRISTIQNGNIESNLLNYTGLNWQQTIRINGKLFGKTPTFETDNFLDSQLRKTQIQDEIINSYTLETRLLPNVIANKVIYDLFLSNKILITDYNIFNEDVDAGTCQKTYTDLELYPDEFAEPTVFSKSVQRLYEFKFVDKKQNNRKRNF